MPSSYRIKPYSCKYMGKALPWKIRLKPLHLKLNSLSRTKQYQTCFANLIFKQAWVQKDAEIAISYFPAHFEFCKQIQK